jgi:hypothetical protein
MNTYRVDFQLFYRNLDTHIFGNTNNAHMILKANSIEEVEKIFKQKIQEKATREHLKIERVSMKPILL